MAVSSTYRSQLQRLGAVVRVRRRLLGYSSAEKFAEVCGLSPNYIGQVERGEVNMSSKHLLRIARGMRLRVSEWWAEAGL